MAGGETPSPQRKSRKPKKIRLQIGDDLDVNLGTYVSPRAMALLGTLVAGAGVGGGGYLLQRQSRRVGALLQSIRRRRGAGPGAALQGGGNSQLHRPGQRPGARTPDAAGVGGGPFVGSLSLPGQGGN